MKKESDPHRLIEDEHEGAGAIVWVFASILLILLAIIGFLVCGFYR